MRERRESSLWIMLVILLLTCTTIGSVSVGTASVEELPVIYVDPPTSTAAPNETFAVNVNVANITADKSLYSWEFRMNFNTNVLDAVSVVQGPFLKTVGDQYYGTYYRSKKDNINGWVSALCMLNTDPNPPYDFPPYGASGNGTLCTITFKVEAEGATLLRFESTELYTVTQSTVNPIAHTAEDGFFTTYNHDVAVTSLDAPTKATLGDLVSINVTVANEGVSIESFAVTVYYDSSIVGTRNVVNLASGNAETVEFSWNTTGLALGTYTINATATIALDEDPGDNFKTTTIEIKPYIFQVPELDFNIIVESNSTFSNFEFRQDDVELCFTVSGPTGTTGYCNVAIPMDKMKGEPWAIFVGGETVTHIDQSDNGTHTFLYFKYTHSTKDVIIRGTWVVPEFPALMPLLLTLAFLAVSTIVLRRKTGNNC